MFLIVTGNEFKLIAPLYKTLFLYFSHLGIIVLKRGAARALVLTFLISNRCIHSFFCTYSSANEHHIVFQVWQS